MTRTNVVHVNRFTNCISIGVSGRERRTPHHRTLTCLELVFVFLFFGVFFPFFLFFFLVEFYLFVVDIVNAAIVWIVRGTSVRARTAAAAIAPATTKTTITFNQMQRMCE